MANVTCRSQPALAPRQSSTDQGVGIVAHDRPYLAGVEALEVMDECIGYSQPLGVRVVAAEQHPVSMLAQRNSG